MNCKRILPCLLVVVNLALSGLALGQELSKGQSVYVPVYSSIYAGPKESEIQLTATLSVRNTDQSHPITVLEVAYYDSAGHFLVNYINRPLKLDPLGSTHFVISERDSAGGAGAKFIAKWKADLEVNAPIIESVMVSTEIGSRNFVYLAWCGDQGETTERQVNPKRKSSKLLGPATLLPRKIAAGGELLETPRFAGSGPPFKKLPIWLHDGLDFSSPKGGIPSGSHGRPHGSR